MTMINLKNTKKDKAEQKKENTIGDASFHDYPWGLRIDLNDDVMEKLGLTAKNFKVGATVTLTAKCTVKEVRTTERNGKADQSLELQITAMDIDGKAKKSAGQKHADINSQGPGGDAE